MHVLTQMEISGTADDNQPFPEFVFPAQSRIRKRVGFFDLDVPGMWHCNLMICMALSHFQLMVEEYDRPDLHTRWKASREKGIEKALTNLEDELRRQGIQMS